jgi:hypothetical protein
MSRNSVMEPREWPSTLRLVDPQVNLKLIAELKRKKGLGKGHKIGHMLHFLARF